ncbi:MAG: heme-copper oxidase subunit III [Pyrinomonadaceae bacterium]|jgi:cytochrome c oxidase subunit 3
MRTGIVETLEPGSAEIKKRPSRLSGTGSSGSGRNGGGHNGGDGNNHPPENSLDNSDKAKIVTWFLLLVVLMTFGGLVGAYVVVATNGALAWKPFSLPVQVWISTLIILASSAAFELSKKFLIREQTGATRKWLVATAGLGFAFLVSQFLAWLALVERGLYMSGNPYAGFFYLLTAAHAIHVFGGLVALGAVITRTWYPTMNGAELLYRIRLARYVGWYWHFIGGIWIVLIAVLAFWK